MARTMHELSVCRALLQQVMEIAEEHRAEEISVIKLRIGPLSGIETELLRRSFPLVCHGTIAQNSALEIVSAPINLYCDRCDRQSEARNNQLQCRHCGSVKVQLLSGDEMVLESVVLGQQRDVEEHYVH